MGSHVYIVSIPNQRILFGDQELHWVAGEADSDDWERIGDVLSDEELPEKVEFEGTKGGHFSRHNRRDHRDLREMRCLPVDRERFIEDGCSWESKMQDLPLGEVKERLPWKGYLDWLDEYGGDKTFIMLGMHPIPSIWAEWEVGQLIKPGPMRDGWYADVLDEENTYSEALGPGDKFVKNP